MPLSPSHAALRHIDRAAYVEPPAVTPVDFQVRTGLSVPFAPHMRAADAAPSVAPVNFQVRTGLSVPFASHMAAGEAPRVDAVNFQVRTGLSVPFAPHMRDGEGPAAAPVDFQVRTGLSVPFNPYMLGAHAEELLRKRIMISPVLVAWRYRVASAELFADWLSTREILLSEARLSGDAELKGVRYGGTYRVAGSGAPGAAYQTLWGYTSEAAMNAMNRLCRDDCASASLVELEMIDFVKGLKRFAAEGGEAHFAQEVLIGASAGPG